MGYPVYQHRGGLLFLYQQDGTWLISNEVGSRAGGIQNQGDPSMCPYRFKTAWEYADLSLPGWQWSYDYTASMVCSLDPCSVTKCGQRATCTPQGPEASCSCDIGYDGNPYERCFPIEVPDSCPCTVVTVSSSGRAAVTQSDKMGRWIPLQSLWLSDNKFLYQVLSFWLLCRRAGVPTPVWSGVPLPRSRASLGNRSISGRSPCWNHCLQQQHLSVQSWREVAALNARPA